MSREIKFRAYGKNSREFITDGNGDKGFTIPQLANLEHLEDWDFHQYTGLKDKNGVEIYEGDIVKYGISRRGRADFPYKQLGIVVWETDGGFYRIQQNGSETGTGWCAYGDDLWCEVVGNIYENPELLKGKDNA